MYSNYLETEDKEVIDRLSYFGFNGKYSKINNKYYVYIEKSDLYAPIIKEVDDLIIKWNENHNTNLPTIEQRLDVSLREERNYGKIFNY